MNPTQRDNIIASAGEYAQREMTAELEKAFDKVADEMTKLETVESHEAVVNLFRKKMAEALSATADALRERANG